MKIQENNDGFNQNTVLHLSPCKYKYSTSQSCLYKFTIEKLIIVRTNSKWQFASTE